MADGKSKDLMVQVEDAFMKLPPLSKNVRETLVSLAPMLALIGGVLGLLVGLSGLGLSTLLAPLAVLTGTAAAWGGAFVAAAILIVSSIMLFLAYPGLKAHKLAGWKMALWSEVVWLVWAVVSVSVGAVLGSLIALYLLFQVKSYYK